MNTTKFRTSIVAVAALAAFSTTGVASAAVPGALGDTEASAEPAAVAPAVEPTPQTVAATAPGLGGSPPVAPAKPIHVAQVFRPDVIKKRAELCRNWQLIYEQQVSEAVQIDGNPDGQNQSDADAAAADQAASQTLDAAKQAGCGWAA